MSARHAADRPSVLAAVRDVAPQVPAVPRNAGLSPRRQTTCDDCMGLPCARMLARGLTDEGTALPGGQRPGCGASTRRGTLCCNRSGLSLPLLNGPTEFAPTHPYPTQFTTEGRKQALPGDLLFCVRGSTTGRMNWADQTYSIGRCIAGIRHKWSPKLQPLVRQDACTRIRTAGERLT